MLKVIGFNGSPRKGWNTDLLVQKALEGCKSLEISSNIKVETKLIQCKELNKVVSCQSCYSCKSHDDKLSGRCVIKDDITPILKEVRTADAIIFGTPIYWGLPSALIHPLLERIWYSNLQFNKTQSSFFNNEENKYSNKKIKTCFIFTMGVGEKDSQQYEGVYAQLKRGNETIFGGKCEMMSVHNTLHCNDYSIMNAPLFNEEDRKRKRKEEFPIDLQKAFDLGRKLLIKD